ncbi:MAG: S1/P1 nuclease [Rhodanobacteraceae bacterium]|jgi:hypothetical protein|nr:S1/P1 nuclease [Rhodanobacteraceae bacterium]
MPRFASLLCSLLLALPALAHAWGPAGHRLVGDLAERQLTPAAKAEAHRLLGRESLADVAPWADELRNDPARHELGRATARLHFVNFDGPSCRYDAKRDCPGGQCVIAAIERYARVLGDRSRPAAERAEALRFLVHFVGDAHQPLHAGYRDDRGGNQYQVQLRGRGTNLHAVWDSQVLASAGQAWPAQAARLAKTPLRAGGTPVQWAEESCRATRAIYPRGHRLDARYLARERPLAERRVRQAAARLAGLLNRELGTPAGQGRRKG